MADRPSSAATGSEASATEPTIGGDAPWVPAGRRDAATGGGDLVPAAGPQFPIHFVLADVPAVIISEAEFERLRAAAVGLPVTAGEGIGFRRVSASPIARDAEVAAFLGERFGSAPLDDLLTACADRFGADRTPSRSAAHRFWVRLRAALK